VSGDTVLARADPVSGVPSLGDLDPDPTVTGAVEFESGLRSRDQGSCGLPDAVRSMCVCVCVCVSECVCVCVCVCV
jgi:hypothetical protein